VAHFRFDDELIESLDANKDLDACGVLAECKDETCPCALLGRDGRYLQAWCTGGLWFACIGPMENASDDSGCADLGDAVRAAQAAYEAGLVATRPPRRLRLNK
jgi:hypothetical protein